MDTLRKKELFTELMTAMELYDLKSDEPVVLSLQGLSDSGYREAVIAQAVRQSDEWKANLCMGICRAYMEGLNNNDNNEPNSDQLSGLGLAIYLSWLSSQMYAVIKLLALLGGTTDEVNPLKELGFIHRLFAPPPVAVALKNAYLNLNTYELMEKDIDVFEVLRTKLSSMNLDDFREAMEKEGISFDIEDIPEVLRQEFNLAKSKSKRKKSKNE